MTSHQLAKLLLEKPDVDVFVEIGGVIEEIVGLSRSDNEDIVKIMTDVDEMWPDAIEHDCAFSNCSMYGCCPTTGVELVQRNNKVREQ
jgi:hypothetical protein